MPIVLERLRSIYARVRRRPDAALAATKHALRLRHPAVIGLREALVASGGRACMTAVEASWLYMDAVDTMASLPTEHTIAGKLSRLANAFELLVRETKERCKEGLSADDLVPLLTLTLVAARMDVGFEGFVLDELLQDVLASGRESYCACTLAVALGFMREVALGHHGEQSESGSSLRSMSSKSDRSEGMSA